MAISPTCDVKACRQPLVEFGGIVLSPPNAAGMVRKLHICAGCYDVLSVLFVPPPIPPPAAP